MGHITLRSCPALILALLLAGGRIREGHGAPALQAAGMVFQQGGAPDYIVSFEAESFGANVSGTGATPHTWTSVTTPAGFSGSAALQALANSGQNVDTAYSVLTNGACRLDYNVYFTQAGTYYVWIRGRSMPAADVGSSDSCHAGLNGAEIATCDRINSYSDAWTWHNDTMDAAPATFTVPAVGVHTINVWMREDGFYLDKIFVTTNAAFANPGAGTGPAASAQIADPRPQPPTLSGTAGQGSASLSWVPGGGGAPTSYNVLRSTTAGGPYTQIANVTGTTYVDTGLAFPGTYYYVVQAVNASGTSANSNQVTISPLPPPPRISGDNDEGLFGDRCNCASTGPDALGLLCVSLWVLLCVSLCTTRAGGRAATSRR